MGTRRQKTKAWVIAALLIGAGCGGSDAKLVPASTADAEPGVMPDGSLVTSDADLTELDSSPAMADAMAEAYGLPPDAGLALADAHVLSLEDAAASDADLSDADPPDGDGTATDDELGPGGGRHPANEPATVVLLPDTQYTSARYPDIFASQSRWIVDHSRDRRIALALHVGDLVDVYNDPKQWQVASTAMHALDGRVPYTLSTGNHDTDGNRVCPINDYFAPDTMPWIAGTMEPGKIENNYLLADIGPSKWLVLELEFGPRDVVMTWADSVLKAFPERLAIIVTHAYLYSDGHRYDLAVSGLDNTKSNFQWFIPQFYGYTASQGINDGEAIWQKLVLPNPNVRLVFSGHVTGAARLTSRRPDGTLVHQVLSDYQWLYAGTANDLGGSGYLRIMEFDFRRKTIGVQTYSPYLDTYLTDDANQFTLSLEM